MGSRRHLHPLRCSSSAIATSLVLYSLLAALPPDCRADEGSGRSLPQLLQTYCFDCHGREEPKAKISLENMSDDPTFVDGFRDWRRAVLALDQRKMPPADKPQPSADERARLVKLIGDRLRETARQHAHDPGEVVIRRLSSAEYAYTLEDLTGLDLDLDRDFVSDAVGGEGFTNVGTVQFVQDSTLERYLDAAKTVASHAVIGAGKLQFFRDSGLIGRELFSVNRIQAIYHRHGFRARGGELAPPFGMECYPKSFYAAWRYRHRRQLGFGDATLAQLAAQEKVEPRFLEYIWRVMNDETLIHPTQEIAARWRSLPGPADVVGDVEQTIRRGCDDVVSFMQEWQELLATNSIERETGTVFTDEPLDIEDKQPYVARFSPSHDDRTVTFVLSVLPVSGATEKGVVIWRNPQIFFETLEGVEPEAVTLRSMLTDDDLKKLALGKNPGGAEIGPHDFVIPVGQTRTFTVKSTQDNSRTMDLIVETVLDPVLGKDCVVRCDISSAGSARRQRMYSALLGDKDWKGLPRFREETYRLAQAFPEISHREPARADRDPIPPLYGTLWNSSDRNYFHVAVKYYRRDRFLVENILDEATRRELDEAWTDLLTSFDYHDLHLRFAARKHHVDLQGRTIANLLPEQIDRLPTGEVREIVREQRTRPVGERLREVRYGDVREFIRVQRTEYEAMQERLRAARGGHVQDVLDFARGAWRRPLSADERSRLTAFYETQLRAFEDDHPRALRAMLTRVLVSPEFLYRGEGPSSGGIVDLTDWELATRLSYFLWSSVPDDELRRAAAAGELRDAAQREKQARRMLRDPRARRFAGEFFGQWLGFYQFDRFQGVDTKRFPEFNDKLRQALYDEAWSFFERLVREDRPVGEILFADYAFLNKTLADHYGISADVSENAFKKVDNVTVSHRGGLFGMGAVLARTSNPLRTSPVKRGDWVLRRVLGTPVPPPPADAGSIPADDVLADGLTVRERLEAHRTRASCAGCHSRIDPLGFALEHYDTLGRWRSEYRGGQPIDDSGTLSDGTRVAGLDGLRKYLKAQEQQFQRTLCAKLAGYAFGRSESLADAQLIDGMTSRLADDSRFSGLVISIVQSPQFRQRRGIDPGLAKATGVMPGAGE